MRMTFHGKGGFVKRIIIIRDRENMDKHIQLDVTDPMKIGVIVNKGMNILVGNVYDEDISSTTQTEVKDGE